LHLERVPTAVLYDEEGNVSIVLYIRHPLLGRLTFVPSLWTSHQLIACGAEALAARAENRGRSWGQPEHFKMQLHPTFNPSNKKLPVHKSLLSVLRHNCGSAFNRLHT